MSEEMGKCPSHHRWWLGEKCDRQPWVNRTLLGPRWRARRCSLLSMQLPWQTAEKNYHIRYVGILTTRETPGKERKKREQSITLPDSRIVLLLRELSTRLNWRKVTDELSLGAIESERTNNCFVGLQHAVCSSEKSWFCTLKPDACLPTQLNSTQRKLQVYSWR